MTKYDKCGLLLWTLDLNSQQHIDQLNIDSNNNIIVSHSNHTSFETNISKYDPNGNLLWTVPINGIITYAYDDNLLIDIDSNNDIIFSGNVYNNQLNIDGSPIVSSNQKNVVIGKLNSLNGTLIWHDLIKGLTTTGCDLTTNAGFVYLYSKTSSGDSTITFNNSNSQFAINNTGILVRFNALNGNYISSNNLSVSVNKPNVEFLNGNLILSGSSSILYKINTMTATVNSVTVNNVINDIDIDQNSNTIYATHGGNLFATKLDQNLNTLWTLSATSSPFGLVSTGISTFNNKIFMIGRYNNLNQGDIIINNEITFPSADAGFDDAGNLFILRANEENNLPLFGRFQEEEPLLFSQEIDFSIVPNPSNGVAKIFLSDPNENYSIDIIDFTGNKINSSENNPEIDLTSFPKGIYFVKVTDFKGNSRTKKIIKQ